MEIADIGEKLFHQFGPDLQEHAKLIAKSMYDNNDFAAQRKSSDGRHIKTIDLTFLESKLYLDQLIIKLYNFHGVNYSALTLCGFWIKWQRNVVKNLYRRQNDVDYAALEDYLVLDVAIDVCLARGAMSDSDMLRSPLIDLVWVGFDDYSAQDVLDQWEEHDKMYNPFY